ncbi:fimbrillin family protein [Bacteroides sp. OttesenSCG-928-E20]|nr:fimbrillin family protein [Bacteroides sp. OttesenSCG-928-N06]MDL2299461.1 fimbrillin family protein [Bacteroides sp. OttesenSCG-928-E20]
MKLLKLTSTIALALLLTNCQKEETNDTIDTHVPILFSSNTVTVEKAEGAQTRADFEVDDKFQIIVKDNNTTDPFGDKTFEGTAEAVVGTTNPIAVDPILYWDDVKGRGANLMLLGIRKNYGTGDLANKLVTDNKIDWTIAADQSSGLDTYDLITAKNESYAWGGRANPAELNFEHRLTKVTVVIVPGGETGAYKVEETPGATNDLSNATVKFKLPVGGAKYDLVEKKLFYGTPDYTDEAPVPTNISDDVVTSRIAYRDGNNVLKGYSFTVLAYPYTIATGASLAKITIDGNTYDVVISPTGATDLEQGIHNTYMVTVRKSGISVVAGLTDWGKGGGDIPDTRLVTPGDITINGTTETSLKDGAQMTMRITGSDNGKTHTGEFTYNTTSGKWSPVSGTEVYWDDVKRPVVKVEALLINSANPNEPSGEYYFEGTKTLNQDVATKIELDEKDGDGNVTKPFFKRSLCKIDIIVKTSAKVDSNGNPINPAPTDRVNIEGTESGSGIQDTRILAHGGFKIATDGVSLERDGNGNISFTSTDGSYDSTEDKYSYSTSVYILPYTTDIINLAQVEIKEKATDTYTNVYPVNLNPAAPLEAGKHYTYTVIIKKTGVSITGTLEDWGVGAGGTIETGL